MNAISGWLYIIGEPVRAKKLRQLLDRLPLGLVTVDKDCLADPECQLPGVICKCEHYEPPMCPSKVLFGDREAAKLYADPATRPALDAWDQQFVSKDDMRRYCFYVETGKYRGAVFQPAAKKKRMQEAA